MGAKLTIATLKNGLSLNFTLWNIESAAIPIQKTIALGKTIVSFATSGGSGLGRTNERLAPSCPGADLVKGKMLNDFLSQAELKAWRKTVRKCKAKADAKDGKYFMEIRMKY